MARLRCIPLLACLTLPAAPAERKLELRGRIEPPVARAFVTIDGAHSPYTASSFGDSKGRFRFRKLLPGPYTVSVFVPGRGEARRTVEVTPSLADSKGRVTVSIPLADSHSSRLQSLQRRETVSLRELTIPDRARRQYQEAMEELRKRDVPGAIEHLKRAVDLAPQFVAAWNHLGTIAYQSARYEDAEKYFRRALEYDPGAFAPVVNLGGTLLNLGKYEEALKYNRYAVHDHPADALANSQLGLNFFYLGDENQALKYLKTAKRLDPSHFSHPQLALAEIYLRRSNRAAAIAELEDFLARHPDDPSAAALRKQIDRLRQP